MTVDGLLIVFMTDRAMLLRFLIARGASPAESEDILQELFLKLRTVQVGPVSEPKSYLYRMAHNLLNDRRRAATRQGARESAWASTRIGADGQSLATPSIEDSLIQRERLKTVEATLAALPERTSFILRRYRVDGVSQKTIAADLGIALSSVEKHLQRAYRAILDVRQRLDADSDDQRRLGTKGDDRS
ncbi:RNA polymerase sigma factor [Sphingomonas paeninsulae]|jgi:RNA polymerase sigma factor (sigma-70 family)|uniref:RNA polymerase sigma factor n=1 Tax=Sphingomonas paeninsulae TaxID=2319844 RepID=A0A494TF64_SPHPE|nr:RNA polymerase sigma factor [Sphingomonas paeninsulae]AYJ85643.1 RNA polymerase sigma factor [Sphingomonas paeninsulae]